MHTPRVSASVFAALTALLISGRGFSADLGSGKGIGLRGEYRNSLDLSGPAEIVRTDPTINFNWASQAAGQGVTRNRFSVRWVGFIEAPVTGNFAFSTTSSSGIRLWVNGINIINNWTAHAAKTDTATPLTLIAGRRYAVRIDYFTETANGVSALSWAYPGQAQQPVPQARLFPPDTTYLSDLPWISGTSGVGPVERDQSAGGAASGDGRPFSINGIKFAKGLGVAAPSEIKYALGKRYTDFDASIGIDDESAGSGTARFQVWLDGQKSYESPVLSGNNRPRYVHLNVAGVDEMKLVVVGVAATDHADWADAQLRNNLRPALTDLSWSSARNGLGPVEIDQSNGEAPQGDGQMLSIDGRKYQRGLGVHAPSAVSYDLNGQFISFTAEVGLDDEVRARNGSVIFQIFVDGTKAFETPVMRSGQPRRLVSVNLTGRRELTLVVTDAGDGNTSDHADWGEATLVRSSSPVSGLVVPAAPANLSANGGNNQVLLKWTASATATGYNVYRSLTANADTPTPLTTGVSGVEFVDKSAANGTKYYYRVAGVNRTGIGPRSNEASATPGGSGTPAKPEAPTALSAEAGAAQIKLKWNAATGATSYSVFRSLTAGGQGSTALAAGIATTAYTDNSAQPNVKYFYKVAGVNTAGAGLMSNEASATATPPVSSTKPDAPTGLAAEGATLENRLKWNAAAGATTYSVFRSTAAGGQGATALASGIGGLTYTDKSAQPGTKYYYKVAGVNAAGAGPLSNEANATALPAVSNNKPEAPAGLVAEGQAGRVMLKWNPAAGASSYAVFRGTSTNMQGPTPIPTDITGTTYVDSNVKPGVKYFYRVAGVNAAGMGPMSNEATATPPISAPAAPTDLTAVPGDNQIKLTWKAGEGAATYNVYRGTAPNGEGSTPLATGLTALTYTDGSVKAGVKYYYKVAGVNTTGVGGMSNEANAAALIAAPLAPAELTAEPGDKQIKLTWKAGDGAATYNVYRGTAAGGQAAAPVATGITGLTFTDPNLTNGTRYFYKVAGVNTTGTGALSNEASATPVAALPAAPTGLSATPGDKEVRLSWSTVTGATSYSVFRSTTPGGQGATALAANLTNPAYTDSNLTNGTPYYYKVAAVNATGPGPLSNEATATPNPVQQPSADAAHRFLRQSSWGPTQATLDRVKQIGIDAYITEQFAAPVSTFPDSLYDQPLEWSQEQMTRNAITGQDQLRQRIAWALHKIWVVSGVEVSNPRAFLPYYRTLMNGAFGNYYDLMRAITLTPAMGEYLDMVNNGKAADGMEPNENFAREIMQLFTIGLVQLNPNGTPQSQPTYGQADVLALARAFTGWTYSDNRAGSPTSFQGTNYNGPMEPVESQHDTTAKTFLGVTLPPGQTATQDLDQALRVLFNHPNTAPFLAKALIQQLVTSDPNPAYVQRVATAFTTSSGDLRAVVRAIFTDTDAALGTPEAGRLREPVQYLTSVMRGLGATLADYPVLTDAAEEMSQRIFFPPSVFSYFSPNARINGFPGPEFQIYSTYTALRRPNWLARVLRGDYGDAVVANYAPWNALTTAQGLVDRANQLFMGGQMSTQMQQEIVRAIDASPTQLEKVRTVLYLTLGSSQYQVEH